MLQDIFFVVAFAERSFAWQDLVGFRSAGYFRNRRIPDVRMLRPASDVAREVAESVIAFHSPRVTKREVHEAYPLLRCSSFVLKLPVWFVPRWRAA